MRRRMVLVVAATVAGSIALAPRTAIAEGLFDFFFGGAPDAAGAPRPAASQFLCRSVRPQPAAAAGVRAAHGRLRSCFLRPQLRRQVFSGHRARQRDAGADVPGVLPGERHQSLLRQQYRLCVGLRRRAVFSSENAFAYRKALRADCTCNGRDPAGLAPVDLTLDGSLRPGDVIATTGGLVAYTGVKVGNSQTAEFTPVASYPGLTADVRARLGEMKVAPVSAEMIAEARCVRGAKS